MYMISFHVDTYSSIFPLPEEAPPGLPVCSPQVRTVNPSKPKVTVRHSRADVRGFYTVHLWPPRPVRSAGPHTTLQQVSAAGGTSLAFTGGRFARRAGLIVFSAPVRDDASKQWRAKCSSRWNVESFLPVLSWCVYVACDGHHHPGGGWKSKSMYTWVKKFFLKNVQVLIQPLKY